MQDDSLAGELLRLRQDVRGELDAYRSRSKTEKLAFESELSTMTDLGSPVKGSRAQHFSYAPSPVPHVESVLHRLDAIEAEQRQLRDRLFAVERSVAERLPRQALESRSESRLEAQLQAALATENGRFEELHSRISHLEASMVEARSQKTTSEAIFELERFELRSRLEKERRRVERARRTATSPTPPQPPPQHLVPQMPSSLPPAPPTVVVTKRSDRDGKRALKIVRQLQVDTTRAVVELQARVDNIALETSEMTEEKLRGALERVRAAAEERADTTKAALKQEIEDVASQLKKLVEAMDSSRTRLLALEGDAMACSGAVETQRRSLEQLLEDNRQRLRHEKDNYILCARNAATTRVVEADIASLRQRFDAVNKFKKMQRLYSDEVHVLSAQFDS